MAPPYEMWTVAVAGLDHYIPEYDVARLGNQTAAANNFFDEFFYIVAAFVALMAFMDWLLSPNARTRQREAIGDLWTYLEITSYASLVRDVASLIVSVIGKFIGPSPVSRRFLVRIVFLAAVLLLASALAGSVAGALSSRAGRILSGGYWTMIRMLVPELLLYMLWLWPFTIVCTWASLSVSMLLLNKMARGTSPLALIGLLFIDLIISLLIFTIAIIVVNVYFASLFGVILGGTYTFWYVAYVNLVISALPTVLHMALTALLLALKIISPVLKKPFQLLIARVYESPKGVLSTFSFGLGAFAKLVQEGFKVFAS